MANNTDNKDTTFERFGFTMSSNPILKGVWIRLSDKERAKLFSFLQSTISNFRSDLLREIKEMKRDNNNLRDVVARTSGLSVVLDKGLEIEKR